MNTVDPQDGRNLKTIEDILEFTNPYGCFQRIINLILGTVYLCGTLHCVTTYFVARDPKWRCVVNSTVCCHNTTRFLSDKKVCSLPRSEWEYAEPIEYSIVAQFDLICRWEWMIYVATSAFYFGWGMSSTVVGMLADRCGRKIIVFPFIAFLTIMAIASAFSPNIYIFILCRFVIGVFTPASTPVGLVLMGEFVDNKHRPIAATISYMIYSLGYIVLGVTAYFVREWKMLLIVSTSPYMLLIVFHKFLPESVHWLHSRHRKKEINAVFKRIAYWNNVTIPDDITASLLSSLNCANKNTICDLFGTSMLARRTFNLAFGWFTVVLIYFGISFAANDLGGSLYLNFILVSAVEIPSNILLTYTSQRFGRKKTVTMTFIAGSLACLIVAFIPPAGKWTIIRLIFGILGKALITMAYHTLYIWSMELYPTDLRGNAMGVFMCAGRLGGGTFPWIIKGMRFIDRKVPFIIMGLFGSVAGFFLLALPETKGISLKSTIRESIIDSRI